MCQSARPRVEVVSDRWCATTTNAPAVTVRPLARTPRDSDPKTSRRGAGLGCSSTRDHTVGVLGTGQCYRLSALELAMASRLPFLMGNSSNPSSLLEDETKFSPDEFLKKNLKTSSDRENRPRPIPKPACPAVLYEETGLSWFCLLLTVISHYMINLTIKNSRLEKYFNMSGINL